MTASRIRPRLTSVLLICAGLVLHGSFLQPAKAIQPEPVDIVVWTVNTSMASSNGAHCLEVGCNWSMFSNAVASKASCPDVVLGQEIRSITDADRFKAELDAISPTNCGVYRRHFYDGGTAGTKGKVAIGWRANRFVHAQVNGNWDAYNKRELWQSSSTDATVCAGTTDLGNSTPSRHVTAVRLLDQQLPGKSLIVGSLHWDNKLTPECMEKNLRDFADGIEARWGTTIPVVIGGDHNKRNAEGANPAEIRTEGTLKPWYTNFVAKGYADGIKAFYTALDTNADGNPDICEQWTYHQDLNTDAANHNCSADGHYRIDYTWHKGLANNQAYTEKGWAGTKVKGNFYSDHRAIVTRYTY